MFSLFVHDAWKVLLYSLLLGAGLPVVYAVGVRSLALGTAGREGGDAVTAAGRHRIGRVVAAGCFLAVLAGVAIGLTYVVAAGEGKMLSFDHVYPTIVPKS
jgi:hypothetical protein